ncbi:exopolygalacturonase [Daucus carota subsp. sativus]|nr:PREDICTED: exopolygalacturonase-like [Daucus carota subsp. sativus]
MMLVLNTQVNCDGNTYSVTDYGAVSDGETDNTQSFMDTWKAACKAGGTMVIPAAKGNFFVNRIELDGPCSGQVTFQLDGVIVAPSGNPYRGSWFTFYSIDGLTVQGSGMFDGNGPSAWAQCPKCSPSIGLYAITNSHIQDITSLNSKGVHFVMVGGDGVTFEHLNITAPSDSPNTDGISMAKSSNIQVVDSYIGTGDDCVAIGQGSTDINISGVNCGPGHGISIGSIGKVEADKDVNGIHVQNCTLTSTQNGVRIKSWAPSYPVTVSNVTYEDITINNASNPIVIDQTYCFVNKQCPGDSQVQISDVKYIGVTGTSASQVAVNLQCSNSRTCQDIHLENIDLTLTEGGQASSNCANANVTYSGTQNPPPCNQ